VVGFIVGLNTTNTRKENNMEHFKQFLIAYAKEEYGKVIDLYKEHHTEFPTWQKDLVDLVYTKAQIEFYSC
jgi:hypothetical protein